MVPVTAGLQPRGGGEEMNKPIMQLRTNYYRGGI